MGLAGARVCARVRVRVRCWATHARRAERTHQQQQQQQQQQQRGCTAWQADVVCTCPQPARALSAVLLAPSQHAPAGGSLFKQAPLRATVKAQASSGGAAGAGHAHAGSGGGSGGGHKALTPPAEAPPEAVAAIAKAAAGGGRLLSGKGGAAHRPRLSTASARGTDEA
jgi:hypothetical protein